MFAAASVLSASGAEVTDGEIWNEGVGYYRDGDLTNAVRVLRPLMLSKTHGARASELVAKIAYDRAKDPENSEPLAALEEAAAAAQLALRANPDGARENRNFTRATDGLAALREAKRIEGVLKGAQGADPGSVLGKAVAEARALLVETAANLTNRADLAVAGADRLAARTERLGDSWIVVRDAVTRSLTNGQDAAAVCQQIDQAEAKTRQAAEEIGDLLPEGYSSLAGAESELTRFWKLSVLPPDAMAADLVAQSNAWTGAETVNGRAWQPEALDFTRAFRAKFPAWARAYEQQAAADTNKPPFTAETQAKVSALATELEKVQLACREAELPPEQEKALGLIREILELLPKDGGGSSGRQGGQQAQDRESQRQDEDKPEPNEDEGSGQQDEPQLDSGEEPPEDEGESEPEASEKPEDREVEAVLKRAQERSDEHEAEKKARMRKFPLPPNERDW